jgi:hypothetical protein
MLNFKIITFVLFIFGLNILISCKDNGTAADDNSNSKIQTFVSKNIKKDGIQYLNFSNNSATSTKPDNWDITLKLNSRNVEVTPNSCIYFEVNTNPAIITAPGITISKINASSLDNVTELPAPETFIEDDTLREAYIGKNWFDAQNHYSINHDVYVIKNCSGNFALLQIKRFDFDASKFQISNIYFDYKYNPNGSLDFTASPLDSSQSDNAYTKARYFSFIGDFLDFGYGSWDIKFDGSSIWLGAMAEVKKIENISINDITTVSDSSFNADHLPLITTDDWYETDDYHHVISKDYVYFVHTHDNKYVAFTIESYYDEQGDSGVFTIKWKYMNL